jgi:DNA-binding NtrC family response regulator
MTDLRAVDLLVGESPGIREARRLIQEIGPTNLNVLLEGPTGSGKELAAQALHAVSRRSGRLVSLNVCAIPDTMFEDAFFGHVRGAFSGALATHRGYLAEADRGTLFLDEIGALASHHQVKLLRAIETRAFRAVGAGAETTSEFRVVSAVNVDLSGLIASGMFRSDLAHRLAGVIVRLPSLRERLEDLPALVSHLLRRNARDRDYALTPGAMAALRAHPWAGNVRELRNVLERAVAFAHRASIEAPEVQRALAFGEAREIHCPRGQDFEHRRLLEVIRGVDGNMSEAARELGMHRATLYRRLRRLGARPAAPEDSGPARRRSAGDSRA